MSSNKIEKNQLIYTKPKTKKFQITKLCIKSNKNEKKSERKRKTDYFITYTKTPSKSKIIDDNNLKHNTKSMKKNSKKRQNKFINKMKPEKDKSYLLNLNINKIINPKDNSILRRSDKTSTGKIDSIKSYKSNSNSNNSTNKMKMNLFQEKKIYNSIKRKKFESDIANINISKTTKINSSNTTIKNSNNINRLNLLSPKEIKKNKFLKKHNNNDNDSNNLNNFEFKLGLQTNIKCKKINYQKNNDFLGKELNYNNITKINKTNIKIKKNYMKEINNKNYNINRIKDKMNKNKKSLNTENILKSKLIKNNKKINASSNNNEKSNFNELETKEIINKKNLNPVKKSLFSDHMNFLNSLNIDRNMNEEKNKNENYYNLNYLNIHNNNVLQSTENKEFESKFINYDLGRTSGTSQIKDSLIVFGIDETHGSNNLFKQLNLPKNQNYFNEEKERTKDELEKLADQYLNKSKNLELIKDLCKKDESQINTITTIIDNNFNEDTL